MILKTLSDITGDAAAHAMTTDGRKAKIVMLSTPSANGAGVRIGSDDVSATNGLLVAAGTTITLPANSDPFEFWQLDKLYYYAGSNDKLYVAYAVDGSNS